MSSRGRYDSKWVCDQSDTVEEMRFDEESLVHDDEFHNAFQEVDLEVIAKDDYKLCIE